MLSGTLFNKPFGLKNPIVRCNRFSNTLLVTATSSEDPGSKVPKKRTSRKSTPQALPQDNAREQPAETPAAGSKSRMQRLQKNSIALQALVDRRAQRKEKPASKTSTITNSDSMASPQDTSSTTTSSSLSSTTTSTQTPSSSKSTTSTTINPIQHSSLSSPSSPPRAALPFQPPSSTPSSLLQVQQPPPPQQQQQQRHAVKVRFWLPFKVNYGEEIYVVGSCPELGSWILSSAVPLKWSDNDVWNGAVNIPSGSVVEYKYVVVGAGGHAVMWQTGNNSVLALRLADDDVEVYDNWTGSPGAQVVAGGAAPSTREDRLLAWANEIEAQLSTQRQELRRARMELVAAQEEARIAREDARRLKQELLESERQRLTAVTHLKHAETTNQLLQVKLTETASSFREALETAVSMLDAPKRSSRISPNGVGNGTVAAEKKEKDKVEERGEDSGGSRVGVGGSSTHEKSTAHTTTTTSSTSTKSL